MVCSSSKTAPKILIFSIAIGADHSFYVKTIKTHARAFLTLNIVFIGTVRLEVDFVHHIGFVSPKKISRLHPCKVTHFGLELCETHVLAQSDFWTTTMKTETIIIILLCEFWIFSQYLY